MTENTVEFDVDFSVLEEFLESAQRAQGMVYYSAPYALFVEVDTSYDRGLKPPLEPLIEWVERNIDTDDVEGTAYAIQNKIFEEGISGTYFLTQEKNKMKDDWVRIAEQYQGRPDDPNIPEKIVEDMLGQILQQSQETIREESYDTGTLHDSAIVIIGVDPDSNTISQETINTDDSI